MGGQNRGFYGFHTKSAHFNTLFLSKKDTPVRAVSAATIDILIAFTV